MIPSPQVVDRARLPLVRVRHPCRDAAEFRARFAGPISTHGIFVPTSRSRSVGARVELVLELRDGSAVRGEALAVDAPDEEEASATGLTFRFVRLFEGSVPLEVPASDGPAPGAGAAPAFEELFTPDEQRELLEGAVVEEGPAGVEAEDTIEVPLREDVVALRGATEDAERLLGADRRRGRVRLAAIATAAAALVGGGAWLLAAGHTQREIDALVASADRRLSDGRLAGGGDSALDHLVAARSLRSDDPRVRERLRLVADKLEELAERALARGDYAEAAVHLTAAGQAEPERKRVHVLLGEIARMRGRRPQQEPASPPEEAASPAAGLRRTAHPE